jgi:hypothetical protein
MMLVGILYTYSDTRSECGDPYHGARCTHKVIDFDDNDTNTHKRTIKNSFILRKLQSLADVSSV